MLVLVIGDLHIPGRAINIPAKFRKLLIPGKIQKIICTGNCCDQATYNYLTAICPDIDMVLGDYDELYDLSVAKSLGAEQIESQNTNTSSSSSSNMKNLPHSKIVEIENFKIGIIHGHQLSPPDGNVNTLVSIARYMDVDVLCSGNTHRFVAYEEDGKFFINPGSATGAFSSYESNPTPSFVLMDIKQDSIVVYFYQLADEVIVDRVEYFK